MHLSTVTGVKIEDASLYRVPRRTKKHVDSGNQEVSDLSLERILADSREAERNKISKGPEAVLGVMVLWSGYRSAVMVSFQISISGLAPLEYLLMVYQSCLLPHL